MYAHRNPITDENFEAWRDQVRAAVAETPVPEQAGRPYISAVAVDVEARLAAFFRENPGCTEDDCHDAGFTPAQLTRYRRSAATRAARASERRIA